MTPLPAGPTLVVVRLNKQGPPASDAWQARVLAEDGALGTKIVAAKVEIRVTCATAWRDGSWWISARGQLAWEGETLVVA